MTLSGWAMAYLIVMFDLPTTNREDKRRYVEFRRFLLKDGFQLLQWSIYSRHCRSRDHLDVHLARVRKNVPAAGEVRMLHMTEAQFARMEIFRKRRRAADDEAPEQLVFL